MFARFQTSSTFQTLFLDLSQQSMPTTPPYFLQYHDFLKGKMKIL